MDENYITFSRFTLFVVIGCFFLPLGVMGFVYGKIWSILATQKTKHSGRISAINAGHETPGKSSDPFAKERTPPIIPGMQSITK